MYTSKHKYKHVYLMRHGETFSNIRNAEPSTSESLSINGVRQVQQAARAFVGIEKIDCIMSSALVRSIETATIIGEICGVKNVPNTMFNERELSPLESYSVFKRRAHDALRFIAVINSQCILVCSHAAFIKQMLWIALHGTSPNEEVFKHFNTIYGLQNTGVIHLCFHNNWIDVLQYKNVLFTKDFL